MVRSPHYPSKGHYPTRGHYPTKGHYPSRGHYPTKGQSASEVAPPGSDHGPRWEVSEGLGPPGSDHGPIWEVLEEPEVPALRAALSDLAGRDDVDAERLGAVGFCLGGSIVLTWGSYDAGAAADAWQRVLTFFETHVRSG